MVTELEEHHLELALMSPFEDNTIYFDDKVLAESEER